MSYVIAVPDVMATATTDLADIGSTIRTATAVAALPTTGVVAAGADEVSAAVAALFGSHAQAYQALSAQAAPFHSQFVQQAGRAPGTVTADRGYGEAKVDDQLIDLGVKNVAIPRKGKPSEERRAKEHRKPFRRIVKWRTGSEGRISYLKRGYGWDRARIDSTEGTRIWTRHGVFAHNLVKISALAA